VNGLQFQSPEVGHIEIPIHVDLDVMTGDERPAGFQSMGLPPSPWLPKKLTLFSGGGGILSSSPLLVSLSVPSIRGLQRHFHLPK
jgi:hypothetical protein